MIRVLIPLALLIVLAGLMLVSMLWGRRLGRRAFAAAPNARPAGLGTVETVAFALLGLLLAFTFSGAATRLDLRRAQIVEEANDIGTAWLRLDTLAPADRVRLREVFRRYVDARIATYQALGSEAFLDEAAAAYARSVTIQQELWTGATAAVTDRPAATVVLLPALNAMFDIAATRRAAMLMHPPIVIYVVLVLLSFICSFLVGYEMGASDVMSWAHVVMHTLLLTATLYVILDFEYPRLGLIRIDSFDDLIVQVRASMN